MPGFYCNSFLCGRIADTLCIVGYLFLCLGGSTFTTVFSNFSISYMSLLLFLGSSSTRHSGNGCLVSYLFMLFIDLTWCPIFASPSLILSLFVFGRNPLITAL